MGCKPDRWIGTFPSFIGILVVLGFAAIFGLLAACAWPWGYHGVFLVGTGALIAVAVFCAAMKCLQSFMDIEGAGGF